MKLKKIIFLLTTLLSYVMITNTLSFADNENMDFTMSVAQPKNQIDKTVTYLDLLMEPSQTQNIEVTVNNTGKKTKTFQVTPTNAITNIKGEIEYSKQNQDFKYDDTLTTPFTSLISGKQEVEIEAGNSKTLIFKLQYPKEPFEGIILGGLVTDIVEDEDDKQAKENVTFINKFQMIKGVVLHGVNEKSITPIIKLNNIKPALYSYRTAVTANLQNTSPVLVGGVAVDAQITKFNSDKVIKSEKRTDIEFAPNSNFDFPIMWDNEPLEPGRYTLNMTVKTKEENFTFDKNFEISKEQSYRINEEAIELVKNNKEFVNYFIIAGIALVIILVIYFLFWLLKTKKESNIKQQKIKSIRKKNIAKLKNKKRND